MNVSLVFITVAGSARLSIEYGDIEKEFILDDKTHAVYVPPASWIKAYDFSEGAILLGLSDKQYKDCKYINDYSKYKRLIGEKA